MTQIKRTALALISALGIVMHGMVSPARAQEVFAFELVEQIGPEFGGGFSFGRIVDGAVDDDGNIYVLDQMNSAIFVFDPGGRFVRTIGSRGRGPGEFSNQPTQILVGEEGALHVVDPGLGRISTFGPDGGYVRFMPLEGAGHIAINWALADERTLVAEIMPLATSEVMTLESPTRPTLRLISSESGERLRDLVSMDLPSEVRLEPDGSITSTLFGPRLIWAVTGNQMIATARTDEYRISLRGLDSDVERTVARDVERKEFDSRFREMVFRAQQQAFEEAGLPESQVSAIVKGMRISDRPPLMDALMTEPGGSLFVKRSFALVDWYQPSKESGDVLEEHAGAWDVFNAEGTYVGLIDLPVGFRPLRIRDGKIYGVSTSDLDEEFLLVLAFEL